MDVEAGFAPGGEAVFMNRHYRRKVEKERIELQQGPIIVFLTKRVLDKHRTSDCFGLCNDVSEGCIDPLRADKRSQMLSLEVLLLRLEIGSILVGLDDVAKDVFKQLWHGADSRGGWSGGRFAVSLGDFLESHIYQGICLSAFFLRVILVRNVDKSFSVEGFVPYIGRCESRCTLYEGHDLVRFTSKSM